MNQERSKMRPDMAKCSTTGFMLNLMCVMLGLCEPFVEVGLGRWDKITAVSAGAGMP